MIAFFARHPTAANLLMGGIMVLGIMSIGGIRRETFPDFQPREVEIRVAYPGATATDVEDSICQRIEDAIDGVRFVEEVRCDARENVGTVTVEMVEGGVWQAFKDEIDTAIGAIDDFPAEAEEPVVEELHTTEDVLTVIAAGRMSPGDLKRYAEQLKDRLQETAGISLVEIEGFSDHQLRVELSSEALIQHDLSPADVAAAIRRQSLDVPAGVLEANEGEVLVRLAEERQTPDELGDLVVLGADTGAEVRIRDLGHVVDAFELDEDKTLLYLAADTDHEHVLSDRPVELDLEQGPVRAAVLKIKKTDSEDTLNVAAAVKEFLITEQQERPAVRLIVTQDQSTLVAGRLKLLVENGIQGMLLVMATMWLFFNFRLSFWVVASLPVSFLGAFFLIPKLDLTINMMSMVALLIGTGILMDDGIVIAENIASHRAKGKKPLQAAVDGVQEVALGVLSSFLTTVCILGPLAFLSGNIGRVLHVTPIILALVLTVSLIEAFMILPSHLGHSLAACESRNRVRVAIDRGFDWVREHILGRCVDWAIRWRYLWTGTVAAAFLVALSIPAGGLLKFQAIPELDGDVATARVLMPEGTSLDETERVVAQLVAGLRQVDQQLTPEQPGQQPLVHTVYARYSQNTDAFEAGPHVVTVYADLLTAEKRNVRLEDFFEYWRQAAGPIPGAVAVNISDPGVGPIGRNIEIRALGHDLDQLSHAVTDIQSWLERFDGVDNLTSDLRAGKREFQIRFRPGVLGIDLDSQRMASQLRAAFQGEEVDEIQVAGESYEVTARFDEASQSSLSDLLDFRFTLPDGTQVPLATVASVLETRGWARIARIDHLRAATLRGDVDSRKANTAAVLAELKSDYLPELIAKYPHVRFDLEGEAAEASKTASSILRGMIIGSIGIFILLSFQFRSYIEPLIVMVAIPLALLGVILGHVLLGYPLTLPSLLGYVSLAGVVVNDSILLMLFLKQSRAEGIPAEVAAGQASRDRFRAILITSLTTMAGLIPLTFETSLQAIVLIPLAISIVFGMLTSTMLVLFVIPALYVMLNDFGLTEHVEQE
ncbi:efflux RND transporter permease subunit [Aeoliella mucimassa]|uniref:Efflux pump membrane transporter BepG n=1 Tax=Aeoliella mucimassa TaxID=2527972 RepID=A0A518AGL2_9BACT|nr:efflux RND transporter permease subunit [Aeoliella mucimassa]QDU53866.1 Efflux pump membrane transporter BepG [Aeoliella mucimassa]